VIEGGIPILVPSDTRTNSLTSASYTFEHIFRSHSC
jgi:hypothetical protein